MQGLLGYYFYVIASVKTASFIDKLSRLPKDSIPLTHSWNRHYSPEDLVKTMDEIFDSYQARITLMALVSIFEVALRSFVNRLEKTEKIRKFDNNNEKYKNKKYKNLLKWAFDFANLEKESLYNGGEEEMINRVPNLCCDVDDARRLRNLFIHNHGLFNMRYRDDAIEIPNRQPKMHSEFSNFLKNPKQKMPVLLKPEEYIAYSRSHIELLHYLNDLIQRKYFGLTGSGYYYKEERKMIEWHRVLTGV